MVLPEIAVGTHFHSQHGSHSIFICSRGNRLIVSSKVDLLTSRQHIATRKQLSSRAHDRSEKAKESNNHELQSQLREGSSP